VSSAGHRLHLDSDDPRGLLAFARVNDLLNLGETALDHLLLRRGFGDFEGGAQDIDGILVLGLLREDVYGVHAIGELGRVELNGLEVEAMGFVGSCAAWRECGPACHSWGRNEDSGEWRSAGSFRWSRIGVAEVLQRKLGEVVVGEIVVGAEVDCLGEPLASCDAVGLLDDALRSRNSACPAPYLRFADTKPQASRSVSHRIARIPRRG